MGRERTWAWKYVYFCIASLIFLSIFSCTLSKDASLRKEAQEHLLRGQKLLAHGNYDGALEEYQKILSLPSPKYLEDEALFNMGLVYAHFGNPKRNYEKSLNLFLKILNDYPETNLLEQTKILVGVLLESLEANRKFEKLEEMAKDKEERKEKFKQAGKTRPEGTKFEEHEESREYLIRSKKLLAQENYEGAIVENHKVLSLPERRSMKDEALFNLGLIYAHFRNPQRNIEKSLEYFNRLIKNYPKSSFVEQAKIWVEILEENEELSYQIQKLKQLDIYIEEMKRKKLQ
jgi:tetratricopeptide (TPR) repeat protein